MTEPPNLLIPEHVFACTWFNSETCISHISSFPRECAAEIIAFATCYQLTMITLQMSFVLRFDIIRFRNAPLQTAFLRCRQESKGGCYYAVISSTAGMPLLILDSREHKELGVMKTSFEAGKWAGTCFVSPALERSKQVNTPCLGRASLFRSSTAYRIVVRHIHEECGVSCYSHVSFVSNKMFACPFSVDASSYPGSVGFTA